MCIGSVFHIGFKNCAQIMQYKAMDISEGLGNRNYLKC